MIGIVVHILIPLQYTVHIHLLLLEALIQIQILVVHFYFIQILQEIFNIILTQVAQMKTGQKDFHFIIMDCDSNCS